MHYLLALSLWRGLFGMNYFTKKTIIKEPIIFPSWMEKSRTNLVYTPMQLQAWEFNVLHNCPWFVDCPLCFSPFKENAQYKAANGIEDVQGEEDTLEKTSLITLTKASKTSKKKQEET